jgi:hypothetical protein
MVLLAGVLLLLLGKVLLGLGGIFACCFPIVISYVVFIAAADNETRGTTFMPETVVHCS